MKTKNILMSIFVLSFLMCLTMVSGAITGSITPATGIPINGTYLFNISTTGQENTVNCTWSTTENSNFAITLNESGNQTYFINSTNTSGFAEENDVTLTITCYNNSGDVDTTNVLLVSFDNADPTCSFSLPIGDNIVDYMDAYGIFPLDASTDTTALTYAWTLTDPSGNSQATSAISTPNFASEDFDEIGEFTLGLTVTDEVLKSNTCTSLIIDVKGTDGDDATVIQSSITQYKTPMFVGGIILILLIIVVAGYFIIIKSKK